MRTTSALLLAGFMLAASTAATAAPAQTARSTSAAGLSYQWVDGRVLMIDPDEGDDGIGIRIAGSMPLQQNLFVTGGLTVADTDPEITQIDPTLGWRHPLTSRIDFVALGSLLWTKIDCDACEDDDDLGFGLAGGVRSKVAPQIELGGYVGYEDTFDDSTIELTGEGLYSLNHQLQLVGGLSLSSDFTILQLGARWNF